jgi:hypothetical protein
MTSAESAIQQSTVDTPSKKAGKTETAPTTKPTASSGLNYYEGYPKAIRKTIAPTLKEELGIIFDFAIPNDEALLIDEETIKKMINELKGGKAPRYWFNKLVNKQGYENTLRFILNLKATLFNSANANLLKDWRLGDKIKIPPQDMQEVGSIASLYEKKKGADKIIDLNTRIIREYILEKDEEIEERKEIIINIALGNVGGLYKEIVERAKGGSKKEAST